MMCQHFPAHLCPDVCETNAFAELITALSSAGEINTELSNTAVLSTVYFVFMGGRLANVSD